MALQKQLVQVPLGGLDTKTDALQVPAGKLLELENAQFIKGGRLSKRYGYDVLSTNIEGGGTIQAGAAISAFNDELLLFDGAKVYSFVTATGNWLDRGVAVSVIASDRQIVRTNNTQQLNPDVAYLAGVEVYAWEDNTLGVRYSSIDAVNGSFAASNQLVSGIGQRPKVLAFGDVIAVLYTDGVNNIFVQTVNPHNPTVITSAQVLVTDGYAGGVDFGYDAAVIGGKLFIGYLSADTTNSIKVQAFNTDFTGAGSRVIETVAAKVLTAGRNSCVNVVGDAATNVWVSWGSGVDVRTSCVANNLGSTILADTLVETIRVETLTGIESSSTGVLQLIYQAYDATPSKNLIKAVTVTQGGVVTAVGTLRSVGLATKAFARGSNRYVNVAFESALQSTYFTVQVNSTFPVVAKVNSQVGGGLRTNNVLSEAPLTPTGILWANNIKGKLIVEVGIALSLLGVNSTHLDFDNSNKFISVTGSGNLLFVGGILSNYDGVSTTEHGFHVYPEDITLAHGGADGFLSAGTYQYCETYEWTDNLGQIHRSAPSVPKSVTVLANEHVVVTSPTLRLTAKRGTRSNPSIVIYRTKVNGTQFYRVTSALSGATLVNDPTVDTINFTDTASDANLTSELLYTSGNILENIAPPACKLTCQYGNRIILAGLEDKNLLWFSKNKFDNSNANSIPTEFAARLTIGCDPRGGGITALGALDDKLIIWKESAIFAVAGDGPNDTGGGQLFPDPQLVTSDAGCTNPNSVEATPDGLVFESGKGIYLLKRDLSVSYLGAPVEDFSQYTITSATLNVAGNQVIFTTDTGPALVYDYYYSQWSTWTNHRAVDSGVSGGKFVFLKANGQIYSQNESKFTDGSVPISMSFTTPNLSFAQLNGFQRVFRVFLLGLYKGKHKLEVSVAYDFNPSYTQTAIVDATANVSTWGSDPTWGGSSVWGGEYRPYEYRVDFKTQKCTAIRLKVRDAQTSEYSEGYSMSMLTFDVGALPDGNRLRRELRVGTR